MSLDVSSFGRGFRSWRACFPGEQRAGSVRGGPLSDALSRAEEETPGGCPPGRGARSSLPGGPGGCLAPPVQVQGGGNCRDASLDGRA